MFVRLRVKRVVFWFLSLAILSTLFFAISGGAEEREIFCPECGTKNNATNKFCGNCGTQLPKLREESSEEITTQSLDKEVNFRVKRFYDFGVEAFKKGMYDEASDSFQEVIRIYPGSEYARNAQVFLEAAERELKWRKAKISSEKKRPSTLGTIVGVGATILLMGLIF